MSGTYEFPELPEGYRWKVEKWSMSYDRVSIQYKKGLRWRKHRWDFYERVNGVYGYGLYGPSNALSSRFYSGLDQTVKELKSKFDADVAVADTLSDIVRDIPYGTHP